MHTKRLIIAVRITETRFYGTYTDVLWFEYKDRDRARKCALKYKHLGAVKVRRTMHMQ